MAKSRNNVVTHGLSGKIGDLLVFRQRNGQTIVSKIPEKSKTESEKQAAHRKRFQQAIIYAKSAIETPETGELYKGAAKKKKSSPMNIAVADFFNAPDIEQVDMSGYTGAAGDVIRMNVTDDFAVLWVKVSIGNAEGVLIETGEATRGVGSLWTYAATQNNDNLDGCRIEISASDMPGNVVKDEITV